MSSTLIRKRLRCELNVSRCPDAKFTAKLTGQAPQAAKAGGCEWELFLKDDDGTPFDISNIASLTLQITNSTGTVQTTKTITRAGSAAGSLNPGCTQAQWDVGTAQHALLIFSGAEMNFTAGSYLVQVYGFTDDDVGDNDPFGISDFTLVEMYLNAGAAAAAPGKTPVYSEDLAGIMAGVIRVDNANGVTFKLRNNGHICEFAIDPATGEPTYNFS